MSAICVLLAHEISKHVCSQFNTIFRFLFVIHQVVDFAHIANGHGWEPIVVRAIDFPVHLNGLVVVVECLGIVQKTSLAGSQIAEHFSFFLLGETPIALLDFPHFVEVEFGLEEESLPQLQLGHGLQGVGEGRRVGVQLLGQQHRLVDVLLGQGHQLGPRGALCRLQHVVAT